MSLGSSNSIKLTQPNFQEELQIGQSMSLTCSHSSNYYNSKMRTLPQSTLTSTAVYTAIYNSLHCHLQPSTLPLEFQKYQQYYQNYLWSCQNYPWPLCFIFNPSVDKRHNMPDASTESFELSHLLKCCWGTPMHLKEMFSFQIHPFI